MYLSGHPMANYSGLYKAGGFARIDEIFLSAQGDSQKHRDDQRVRLLAIVTQVRKKVTKSGGTMAFVGLEDMYGSMTALVFPKSLDEFGSLLYEGAVIEASGRLSFREEKEPELLCDSISRPPSPDAARGEPDKKRREGLYLKVDSKEDPRYIKAMKYLAVFDEGRWDLYIAFRDSGKLLRAPAKYRVDVNPSLVRALEKLLGSENVAFIGKMENW